MDARMFSATAVNALEQLSQHEKPLPASVVLTQGSVISTCAGAGLSVLRFFFNELDFSERSSELFIDIATLTILGMADYPAITIDLFVIESLMHYFADYKLSKGLRDAIKASLFGFDVSVSIAENLGNLYYGTMFSMVGKTIGEEFVNMNDDNALVYAGDENGQRMAKA